MNNALVALLLLTHTLVLVLDGNMLLLTLAVEATVLHYVARRFTDRIVAAGAHLLFFIAALWLIARLLTGILEGFSGPAHPPALFDIRALIDLVVISLALAASKFVLPRKLSVVYSLAGAAAFSLWLARELSTLPDGDAFLLLAWSVYAFVLHLVAARIRNRALYAASHVQFLAAPW